MSPQDETTLIQLSELAVSLLRCKDKISQHVAVELLWELSPLPEVAPTVQKTHFLEYVPDLLDDDELCSPTCGILSNMTFHTSLVLDESIKERLEVIFG
ncbi:hypothetical protein R3P38DRAFT_3177976 [Favolaschia claudopus]|uniref:Uncharacterized protein n=1 Tax=Favolaschia claudopus TaxID=2862362 RepID=A0AAW0CX20_9AGAR